MLQLTGVEKRFGDDEVLASLDFAVAAGQCVVVLGPSGCGKSTLLRLINGLLEPDAGNVWFDGRLLDDDRLGARRRMGYVIQGGGLFPHLTAFENVGLAARHLGRDPAWIDARVGELAALTQLPTDALDRYPKELSGGQRQRVSLMRALCLDPELLLLDEPLGALDPMIRRELQDDLRTIFKELGKTVVMVTHDLAEAAFFADEVVLLHAGELVQRGPFRALIEQPANPFVTKFVQAQRQDWMGAGA